MSLHKETIILVKNKSKTLKSHLKNIPRIGELLFLPNKKRYRIVDIHYIDDWYNTHSVFHQVDVIVKEEDENI